MIDNMLAQLSVALVIAIIVFILQISKSDNK